MNNHGRCLKSYFDDPQNVTQAVCDSKYQNLLWGKRIYNGYLREKTPLCNTHNSCISAKNETSHVSTVFYAWDDHREPKWDIVGGGNQLAQGNNCLAIQGDSGDIGSRAVMVPCDPKQKGQLWSLLLKN